MNEIKARAYRLLRKSEKYTKTDMVYLASGGFWLTLKALCAMAIAFGVSVAFANLLPPATYGAYKYIFSIYGFLSIATLSGMGTALTRAVAQGYEGTPFAALQMKMRWAMLGSIGAACVSAYYFLNGNASLGGGFALVALFLPVADTLGIFNPVLNGKKLFGLSAAYEIAVQVFAACVIVLSLYFSDSLLVVLASYFVSYTLARAFALWLVARRYMHNKDVAPDALVYGRKLSFLDMPALIAETVDTILLWQFAGPVAIATYAFAKGVPAQMSSALQRFVTLALPKFAVRDYADIRNSLVHKMFLVLGFMVIIVSAYWLAAPYLFSFFFPQYMDAVFYTQLFALTLLFFPQKLIAVMFEAHARTRPLAFINVATPAARIAFSVVLIPMLGIMGALLSELATRLINLIIILTLFVRTRAVHDSHPSSPT